MVKGRYNAPILHDRTILSALDQTPSICQLGRYFSAFSNRILWKSAIQVRKELNLSLSLNTLHIRYLLITFFTTLDGGKTTTTLIERQDYPKKDNKRLITMLALATCGLCEIDERSERGKIFRRIGITDKGIKALRIVDSVINETVHMYPKENNAKQRKTRIDKDYNLISIIDSGYKKGKK